MAPKDMYGDICLVTGAASGLGRMLAVQFARRGCVMVLWDIQYGLLEETRDLILRENAEAEVYLWRVDLSDREDIYRACAEVIEDCERVDILVNNAGIVSGRNFLECSDASIQRTMDVNAMAHMWLAKALLPAMIERNYGHIVTIASAAATTGVVGLADYCASKWAAFGFDESLRMELQKLKADGVHTTCVCPYYINTGMFDGVKGNAFLPILEPKWVVSEIMAAVESNKARIMLPATVNFNWIGRSLLPIAWCDALARILGVSNSMDTFKGRGEGWAK